MVASCAKSILKYFQKDSTNTAILIKDMDMQEAITINDSPEPQIVRIEANCVWKQKKVQVEVSSADSKGKLRKVHAKATVVFDDHQRELQNLRRNYGLTGSRIQNLKSTIASGQTERFTTSMAYRMVASLAHYDASHKGVKECYLNSTSLEASSLVSSAKNERLPGDFTLHPCTYDSILQLATFVMNANENSRFDQEVFVVRGWESVFIDGILSPDKEYEAYVKMTARDKDVSVGDIAIMKENSLIGCIRGVRVQRVPRRLMDVMFRPKADKAAARAPVNDTPTVKPKVNGVSKVKETPKVKEAPKVVKAPSGPSKLDTALAIVSEESCIAIKDLEDENLLSDIGIDSLLILVIASRFREELQMDLNPSFFMEVNSIGAIKAYFGDQAPPLSVVESALPVERASTADRTLPIDSRVEAPANSSNSAGDPSKLDTALAIVSEESCIAIEDLEDENLLSDIGIDSLLILVIASRFREELQMDLDPSFFMEVNSIGAIKAHFSGQAPPISVDQGLETSASSSDADTPPRSSDASSVSDESDTEESAVNSKARSPVAKKIAVSTSIILQGTPGPKTRTMFMFPDGSGSATSYMHLPRVHEDVAVVAMNCPYMTNPQDMEGTFEDITRILLAEVRRRQPKGPYYIGGWSAGGAFAHLAARILIEAGEEVKSLLLIDAPCPIGLGKLPQSFFDYWRETHQPGGVAGDRPLPSWLMDHFKAVNENLRWYNANPLPRGHSPTTYLAWAAKGTDNLAAFPHRHLLTPAESEDLGFLMDDKTDFGPKGWEKLIEGKINIETAMTSNHFTITRGAGAKLLSGLIKKACFGPN